MRVLSVFGIVLSAYAVYVEHKVTEQRTNPHSLSEGEAPFVALCDLGGWASCSDVLTSPSSRLFGPSNASLGVLFYAIIMLYPSVTFVPFREELLMAATAFSCVSAHTHEYIRASQTYIQRASMENDNRNACRDLCWPLARVQWRRSAATESCHCTQQLTRLRAASNNVRSCGWQQYRA